MGAILARWFLMAVAVWLAAAIVPGVRLRSFGSALVVSGVYGVLNVLLGRILWFVLFPLAVLTVGIAINVVLLWLTDKLVDSFEIDGFFPLLGCAVLIGVASFAIRMFV